jgi:hypothetical protein
MTADVRDQPTPSPSWSVEDTGAGFIVKDDSGQKLGYVYYEEAGSANAGQDAHRRRAAAYRAKALPHPAVAPCSQSNNNRSPR